MLKLLLGFFGFGFGKSEGHAFEANTTAIILISLIDAIRAFALLELFLIAMVKNWIEN